jgi:hypothetical protein
MWASMCGLTMQFDGRPVQPAETTPQGGYGDGPYAQLSDFCRQRFEAQLYAFEPRALTPMVFGREVDYVARVSLAACRYNEHFAQPHTSGVACPLVLLEIAWEGELELQGDTLADWKLSNPLIG